MHQIKVKRKGAVCTIAVRGDMTIYSADEMKDALLAAADSTDINIDLREVGDLDTAGIQLLLLVQREVLARGRTFTIGARSETAQTVLALLGLVETLTPRHARPHPETRS